MSNFFLHYQTGEGTVIVQGPLSPGTVLLSELSIDPPRPLKVRGSPGITGLKQRTQWWGLFSGNIEKVKEAQAQEQPVSGGPEIVNGIEVAQVEAPEVNTVQEAVSEMEF